MFFIILIAMCVIGGKYPTRMQTIKALMAEIGVWTFVLVVGFVLRYI
jgi:hypothetical protein